VRQNRGGCLTLESERGGLLTHCTLDPELRDAPLSEVKEGVPNCPPLAAVLPPTFTSSDSSLVVVTTQDMCSGRAW
jgi:hypothetical protein